MAKHVTLTLHSSLFTLHSFNQFFHSFAGTFLYMLNVRNMVCPYVVGVYKVYRYAGRSIVDKACRRIYVERRSNDNKDVCAGSLFGS